MLKWVEIDLAAIRANTRWVLSRLGQGARLMAVVKADGYGHGAAAVARAALEEGAACLGVLTVDEARTLRRTGIKAPIQLLCPLLPEAAPEAVRLRLTPTIDDPRQAAALDAAAGAKGLPVHIDLDFGLGRWGISARNLPDFLNQLRRRKRLRLAGISTHIGYVPGKNTVEAEDKLRAFWRLAQRLKREHPGLVCHAANSSVLMDFPHWRMDLARVGIYGGSAGGQNSTRALLAHGDFYKVGVSDCGCHDNRMDKIWWNEQWLGWPVDESYARNSNVVDAPKLEGHLMLAVGELDANVDPATTMQVAHALEKADKDFDLVVMAGIGHGSLENPYGSRRRMDFLVRHLWNTEPRWLP